MGTWGALRAVQQAPAEQGTGSRRSPARQGGSSWRARQGPEANMSRAVWGLPCPLLPPLLLTELLGSPNGQDTHSPLLLLLGAPSAPTARLAVPQPWVLWLGPAVCTAPGVGAGVMEPGEGAVAQPWGDSVGGSEGPLPPSVEQGLYPAAEGPGVGSIAPSSLLCGFGKVTLPLCSWFLSISNSDTVLPLPPQHHSAQPRGP